MQKSFLYVALFIVAATGASFAQSSALLLSIRPKTSNTHKFEIPVVVLKQNVRVSQAINRTIMEQVLAHLDYIGVPTMSSSSMQYTVDNLLLLSKINKDQGVQGLNYTVMYNENNQIALKIQFKHDIALSEQSEYDLAFDLTTGKQIDMTEIADLNEITEMDIFTPTQAGSSVNTNANNTTNNSAFAKLSAARATTPNNKNMRLSSF